MVKRILLVVVFIVVAATGIYGQDLIVTERGDSLNCKITKADKDYVYFTIASRGVNQSTLLPKSDIKSYSYKYYTSEVPSFNVDNAKPFYPRFRLGLHGGYTFRIAKIDGSIMGEEREHIKKMKKGYNIGFNGEYFFKEMLGVGIAFDRYSASSTYQSMKDRITIFYIAPSFSYRLFSTNKRSGFIFDCSLGYLGYLQKIKGNNTSVKTTGGTLGSGLGVGYDVGLSDAVGLSFKISLITGVLSKVKVSSNGVTETVTLPSGSKEGLAHINLTVGIRLQK